MQCNRYQYNAKEQLIKIVSSQKDVQCDYTYNPEGLRDVKTCNSSGDQQMQLDFIYQRNHLINTQDINNNIQSAYLGSDVRYVVNNFQQHPYYFSVASHGTTNLLLTRSANIKQVYNFSSYGQNRVLLKSNSLKTINLVQPLAYNPLTYDGEYQDPETGFVYLRARFYNPHEMRFMQRDSYNLLNRYNAFDDNPVSNTDPSGHLSLGKLSLYSSVASIGLGVIAPLMILPEVFPYIYSLSGALNIFSTGIGLMSNHATSHLLGSAMAMGGMMLSTFGMMSSSSRVNFGLNLLDNTLEGGAMPLMSSDQGSISAKKMGYSVLAALPTAIFLAGSSAYLYHSLGTENIADENSLWKTLLAPDAGLKGSSTEPNLLLYAKPMVLGGIRTASAEYIRKATFFPISQALGEHYQYTKTSLATNMLLGAVAGGYMFSSMAFVNRNIVGSEQQFFGEPRNKFLYNFLASGWSVQFGLPTLESI